MTNFKSANISPKDYLYKALPEFGADLENGCAEILPQLAERLGVISIIERPLQNSPNGIVDGMLIPVEKGYVVALNGSVSKTRQIYSLAHEIGHLVIQGRSTKKVDSFGEIKRRSETGQLTDIHEERICEAIAAELLMPGEHFKKKLDEVGHSLASVSKLANDYKTSITSTAIRYWEVMSTPCLLVKWQSDTRRGFTLKPSWKLRNDVAGPRAQLTMVSNGKEKEVAFHGATAAWHSSEMKNSYESLLTYDKVGRARYATFPDYRAESMGFGMNSNRFVLSAVYLNDRKER